MSNETSGAMEKKQQPPRQSPVQCKTNSSIAERKSDYTANKNNGRPRKSKESVSGSRSQEPLPLSRPQQKWSKSYGDKRPRQKGYYGDRQREEVAENEDCDEVYSTSSRKGYANHLLNFGNANHLLNFQYSPRGAESADFGRWGGYRGWSGKGNRGAYKKTPRYNKEQFLQASCQFVVQCTGQYTEQAINPDALVSWDTVEIVRNFSTEAAQCTICLQVPYAAKITKCGHAYCWACMLNYLHRGEKEHRKCPICYEPVKADDLRSLQWVDVPDYKVGDTIQMKLMRKSKGSVYVAPKAEWTERSGKPLNICDGTKTRFSKLMVATSTQIQTDVIELERAALAVQLMEAEDSEICFIHMAQDLLKKREENLLLHNKLRPVTDQTPEKDESFKTDRLDEEFEKSKVTSADKEVFIYADAFEDEEEVSSIEVKSSTPLGSSVDSSDVSLILSDDAIVTESLEMSSNPVLISRTREDSESSLPFGSPPMPFAALDEQPVTPADLTPEEASDHLELPLEASQCSAEARHAQGSRSKDTYFFYQASTGQLIFMNSLNAQCLTREYGSLEQSPDTITATIVAIERLFMTEDVRKRLRYLNHIPLTCEFHVVELKIKPPTVSKDTLKFFHHDFERRRKARQRKQKEEKMMAKKNETEHKKAYGIYPTENIPLDSLKQFPSPKTASSLALTDLQPTPQEESESLSMTSETGEESSCASAISLNSESTRSRTKSEDLTGTKSFAQTLKDSQPQAHLGVWARAVHQDTSTPLGTSQSMPIIGASGQSRGEDVSDGEGEEHAAPQYSSSFWKSCATPESADAPAPVSGGKKKKRKERQVLFSTAMTRKS